MNLQEIMLAVSNKRIWLSILVTAIVIILLKLSKKFFKKNIELIDKNVSPRDNKQKTYVNLISHIIKYVIIIVGVIFILQINGINVSSILASLGLVSVIIGLALQDALKDIIMGINIIVDGYFVVGDVIKIGEIEGRVLEFNLKTTKLKDVNTGDVLVITNRNIDRALTLSSQLDIDIPLRYEEKTEVVEPLLEEIVKEAKQNVKHIKSIQYMGVNKFGDSAIYYKIRIQCKPEQKPTVKRAVNRIIKVTLDKNNITIPYMQIDIHTK